MKKNCEFCNFTDAPVIIHDDDLCYAVISIYPINKHHVMVIPIKHYENFIDLPDELVSHIFIVAKRISEAVRKACKPDAITHVSEDDVTLSGYNGMAHYKFHIIPRFKKDIKQIDWGPLRVNANHNERSIYTSEIKKHL